ncbi:fluoride efflux transporter CrcB [Lentibacillus saliphilus]|uniref:fluoride efflux transporter CrcB n=1 Tax=Lentibacillus saliphilus TaxID=2737028 RepID=UPI001C2F789D|nr:fluoride efflux transporter CrcB [Lentibacillus saliphilus]
MIVVGIGGALGAAVRYQVAGWMNARMKHRTFVPIGTWLVNMLGSFILGVLFQLHMDALMSDTLWLLLGVGFCGAFTTFSTFGYETITLLQAKKIRAAMTYVVLSVIVCCLAAWIGFLIVS